MIKIPEKFEDVRKAILANLRKQYPKMSEKELEDKSYAMATAAWKKSHGGKAPESLNHFFTEDGREVFKNHVFEFSTPIILQEGLDAIKEDADLEVNGVAVDESVSSNNIRYTREELIKAAESMRDIPILKDHINSVDNIVGRVKEGKFIPNKIQYNGFVSDAKMKEMIKKGLIKNVSIGAQVDELVREKDSEILTAKGIRIRELSLVAVQGVSNATVNQSFPIALCESINKKRGEMMTELSEPASSAITQPQALDESAKLTERLALLESRNKELEEKFKAEEAEKAKKAAEEAFNKKVEEEVSKRLSSAREKAKSIPKSEVAPIAEKASGLDITLIREGMNGTSMTSPAATAKTYAEYLKMRGE